MIVHVAQRGHSFKGAGLYYLHDKKADTSERVAWTHTHNLPTDDPDKGLRWMAHTSMNAARLKEEAGVARTGRKAKAGCVYAFALSWHPEQEPGKEEMMSAAFDTLDRLGLKDHEAVLVAHQDTDHPHVHVICNLVNPKDGRTAVPSYDRLALSAWAEEHEKGSGKIYCEERVKNNEQRRAQAKEERQLHMVKHREERLETARQVQEIYGRSDSGKAFQAALEEAGFTLAKGDRRGFVLVDEAGKIYSLSRQLEGQRARDIKTRLSDIDEKMLPQAKTVAEERLYFDRDKHETEWQKSIVDAAIEEQERSGVGEKKRIQTMGEGKQTGPKVEQAAPDDFLKNLDRLRAWEQWADRLRFTLKEQQAKMYKRDEKLKNISELEKKIGTSNNIFYQLSGKLQALQDELEAHKKTLANIDQRIAEQTAALEIKVQESHPDKQAPSCRTPAMELEQKKQKKPGGQERQRENTNKPRSLDQGLEFRR